MGWDMIYRVLIADDEVMVRAWLKKCVDWEKYGFEVAAEAANGIDVLKCLKRERIDLILTDIRMPIMDGITMLKKIRAYDKRVRVLILTCLDDFSLVKSALELDVTNYILKLTSEPTEIESELVKVKSFFEQRDFGDTALRDKTDEKDEYQINPRVQAACQYLNAHFRENIDLNSIASEVGVTPSYLGKLFLKVYGMPFSDELNRRRIAESKRLLLNPAIRISEIAQSVGFASSAYFFRVFKKYENCTPTEYRMNSGGSDA